MDRSLLRLSLMGMLVAGLLVAGPVAAQTASLEDIPVALQQPAQLELSGDGDVLTLAGPIGLGTGKAFRDLLQSATQVRLLRLESPGGLVGEARVVSQAVHDLGLDTYVLHECASACTLVFYAGKNRWLRPEAQLGFHGYKLLRGRKKPPLPEDALDQSQQIEQRHYRETGLPDWFIDKIFATPNTSIWWPTTQELLASKFATDVTVEQRPGGLVAHDGLPSVNHPSQTTDAAPLPQIIGP